MTLTLAVRGSGTTYLPAFAGRLADALKISDADAPSAHRRTAAAELLVVPDVAGSPVRVTDAGSQLHGRIHSAVVEITERMWGDLPPDDLAAAGRVLTTVLERANAELARP